jgi:hypothetical protein
MYRKASEVADAVMIYDGIHSGFENGEIKARQMKPFVDAAQLAVRGEIFFGMTHSEIDPIAYAGTTATANYLIAAVGAERRPLDPVRDAPLHLDLESMKGAVSKSREIALVPTSEARKGNFWVVGYRGDTKEAHMAHLFQMGSTLLPVLVKRWSR